MPGHALTGGAVRGAVVRYLQSLGQGESGAAEHGLVKRVWLDRPFNRRLVLLNSKCFVVFWNGV